MDAGAADAAAAADTAGADVAQLAQVQSGYLSTTLPADATAVQEVAEPAAVVDGAAAAADADDVALAPGECVSLLHAAAAAAAAGHAVEVGVAKHAAEAAIANGQVAAAAERLEAEVALQVPGVCMHTVIAAAVAAAVVVRAAVAVVVAEDGVAHTADEPDTVVGRLAVAGKVEAEALLSSPCCCREHRDTKCDQRQNIYKQVFWRHDCTVIVLTAFDQIWIPACHRGHDDKRNVISTSLISMALTAIIRL
jgi:hypothetical protein